MKEKTANDILNNPSKTSQNFEYNKIPGFGVLDHLPEDSKMKSYNEEYYSSLSNLKFISVSIPNENKLFYHFEENPNASITTTTGQLYVTYQDLVKAKDEMSAVIQEVSNSMNEINSKVDSCDKDISDEIKPELEKMEVRLKRFLIEQKTENFKLIKEIAILTKEKGELIQQIENCVQRLDRIERDIGKKRKNKSMRETKRAVNSENTISSENVAKQYGDDLSIK